MNKRILVLIAIVIVIVGGVIGLAAWLKSMAPPAAVADPDIKGEQVFVRDYSQMTGSANATVTLVEFGDFQCPFCAQANPEVITIVNKYKSNPNFNFVFRHFPLSQHSNAQITAEAAEAAGDQGKFFEMEELLYQHQNDWAGAINPTNTLVGYAQQLGLNLDKFSNDLQTSAYINKITQDLQDGLALGVNSTPTFFLNGQKVGSYLELDGLISDLLPK